MSMIIPALKYRDPDKALAWLQEAFGLEPGEVSRDPDGVVAHAEMWHGDSNMMFGKSDAEGQEPTQDFGIYVTVDDPDAHCERAIAAGAEIVYGPDDTPYGSREYGVRDLDGNGWSFGTYVPARPIASKAG